MQELFTNHLNTQLAFLKDKKLLVAVSGGIDSVALTHLAYKSGLHIAMAHCNFNLRGKESDADEDFVLQLAEDLDLEVFVESFDTEAYAKANKRSIQMAARELRYQWFEELAEQLKFDYILTAHHADDNLETFLINFTRGTGLEGLTGIPEINGRFVRPLLTFSREAIEAYVKAQKLLWREDRSNASTKYLRNKLRHDVIPILKEINPSLLQSFQNTLQNLNDTASIVSDSIESLKTRAIDETEANCVKIKILEIENFQNPKAYLFELLKPYGFTEWQDVEGLLTAQSGKQVFSGSHRLIKHRDYLLLTEVVEADFTTINVKADTNSVITPLGTLVFDEVESIGATNTNIMYTDKALLQYPLLIRNWQEGDVFYPLGMQGKKKVSKYFKDEKWSLLEKEQALLLCANNQVVWIIGNRADNRFKVTENTKQILKIELK